MGRIADYPDWLAQTPIHRVPRANGELGEIRVQDGHVFVCQGCCCGNTERGFAPIPLDEFKRQWKERRIRRRLHLTVAGCLGPCTMANVVLLHLGGRSTWLHSINSALDVTRIYDYAEAMLRGRCWLPPPGELRARHFQRYLVDSIEQKHCAIDPAASGSESRAVEEKDRARTISTHRNLTEPAMRK